MPYPTAVIGDNVVWVDASGNYVPAFVKATGSRNGTKTLTALTTTTVDLVESVTPTIITDALYSKPTDGISAVSTWHWPIES